jgi:hypothetical protein
MPEVRKIMMSLRIPLPERLKTEKMFELAVSRLEAMLLSDWKMYTDSAYTCTSYDTCLKRYLAI